MIGYRSFGSRTCCWRPGIELVGVTAQFLAKSVGFGQVFVIGSLAFEQIRPCVDTKAVDATIEPERNDAGADAGDNVPDGIGTGHFCAERSPHPSRGTALDKDSYPDKTSNNSSSMEVWRRRRNV